jgi:hypothetical protein
VTALQLREVAALSEAPTASEFKLAKLQKKVLTHEQSESARKQEARELIQQVEGISSGLRIYRRAMSQWFDLMSAKIKSSFPEESCLMKADAASRAEYGRVLSELYDGEFAARYLHDELDKVIKEMRKRWGATEALPSRLSR